MLEKRWLLLGGGSKCRLAICQLSAFGHVTRSLSPRFSLWIMEIIIPHGRFGSKEILGVWDE